MSSFVLSYGILNVLLSLYHPSNVHPALVGVVSSPAYAVLYVFSNDVALVIVPSFAL